MLRRYFLALAAAPPKSILLRSSWQTVNIGDIAHTPGVLTLLEKHLPNTEVRLWPGDVGNGVRPMLERRFPKLRFVDNPAAVNQAFAECDFLLHGSGPYLVGANQVEQWSKATGKPYGVYGITINAERLDEQVKRLLNASRFVYFRDSVSLDYAKSAGVQSPEMAFGPDGAFACDLRDEAGADAYLASVGLKAGQFLCCIPRLRITPYWRIPSKNRPFDPKADARNNAMKEQDIAPLRESILAVLAKTRLSILLCPEDETQMAVGKEMIYDLLPAAARQRVIWREKYWLTDLALSVYRRSAGLFGLEMHSPIMCIGNGIPAIVCRFAEQTSKGFMWRDIGLGDWLFDFEQPADRARVAPAVLAMATQPKLARHAVERARAVVAKRQRHTMDTLARQL
jgi:polysaccharide pyruvyl transferase WcaK-like protein